MDNWLMDNCVIDNYIMDNAFTKLTLINNFQN